MCGFIGVYRLDGGPIDVAGLVRGARVQRHRGPDEDGYLLVNTRCGVAVACRGDETDPNVSLPHVSHFFGDPQFDLGFGFRRLAIHDLSHAGHQPMASRDGRLWIVFNGEIYNYRSLRSELQAEGHRFVSDSDTEVILAAFEQWGEGCQSRFNGVWAFAIWDMDARRLFLSRDRFGEKPLHYVVRPGHVFAFSSEMKGLWASGVVERRIDSSALRRYRKFGETDVGDRTMYEDTLRLPQAHAMTVTAGHVAPPQRHWELKPQVVRERHPEAWFVERFRDLFTDSVRLRLHADVPVGSSLSGGLDSSTVVTLMNRLLPAGSIQKTFSARFDEPAVDEGVWIDEVIKAAATVVPHFVWPDGDGLFAALSDVFWHQEEPFESSSIYAQWCVMRLAREHGVTVLLDGQGADETLGGYYSYFDAVAYDHLRRGAVGTYIAWRRDCRRLHGRNVGSIVRLARRSIPRSIRRPLRTALRGRPKAGSLEPVQMTYPDHLEPVSEFRQLLWWHTTQHGLAELLRYADRNGMAHGIEVRLPFLDHRLVEFVFSLPDALLVRAGWTKWILRQAFPDVVPSRIRARVDKLAYNTPEKKWLGETDWRDVMADALRRIPMAARENGVAVVSWDAGRGDYARTGALK